MFNDFHRYVIKATRGFWSKFLKNLNSLNTVMGITKLEFAIGSFIFDI